MKRALLLAALLAGPAAPAAAQHTLEIERFDGRIAVGRDAAIEVTERIQARFTGAWNGIYRKIPLEYRTAQGLNWSVQVELLGARDAEGHALRVETGREGHYLKYKIWIPGAVDAERTIELRYRVRNALRFFDDHDELYWNVTGDEWDVPLGLVSAEVILPDAAQGVRATAFNGVYGSSARDAEVAVQGTDIRFTMPRKLEYREGLTVVVGWAPGVVPRPTLWDKVRRVLLDNWPLGIPLVVVTLMSLLWYRTGRDPSRNPVMVQYEPPKELTPAEAGTVTDESVDLRDITATIVDLAVRGYLKIEELPRNGLLGFFARQDSRFTRLKGEGEWEGLAAHEREVLEGIFRGAGSAELSDLTNRFYRHIPPIQQGVMDRLVGRGVWRRRPDAVRNGWRAGGVFLGFAIGMGGAALSARWSLTPVPFVVAAVLTALIIIGFAGLMPARTVRGTRLLEQVLGFQEFLGRVDGQHYLQAKLTPEMFERFLPYAMALGVEQHWAKAFQGLAMEPPRWYVGATPGAFNPVGFTHGMSAMTAQAGSVMRSQPRSSSGSGFSSGGGFSGGGGGGGGGGGF